ncbi:long-chain fatty acid--CoA ligase [Xenophilus aerolatus]|nr:long-chain fatty acid--CoA ligase [Xenophilus aerolatus]
MIELEESATIAGAWSEAERMFFDRPFLVSPAHAERAYDPEGRSLSYAEVGAAVRELAMIYRSKGYGVGHRVGLLLDNRLDHLLHKLALNTIGACCVPINPDYRARELAYLIDHSGIDLCVLLDGHLPLWARGQADAARRTPHVTLQDVHHDLPAANIAATGVLPTAESPASILYTSGTTGQPKGCVLSHRYELAAGLRYASCGGRTTFRASGERIYNPLPLFHVNASVLSFHAAMLTGSAQVQPDRFQSSRWWSEVRQSAATIVHYLGVIVQMLSAQTRTEAERDHAVRFGMGAGIEPQLHAAAERRFGFPLLELWGMTENVRILVDNIEPRQVGTRAFGRAVPGIEVTIVDADGREVPDGVPGEMCIRHSAETPRKDFFSGYLNDAAATEAAWRGGWFHTGDVVTRDSGGMLHFVERQKNIIRRAGENIAAAEVEAWLQAHPDVQVAAVMAVPDELREEEVLACVVLKSAHAGAAGPADVGASVHSLFEHCRAGLAYHKLPGWLWITPHIPTTGTQKIQKHQIFAPGVDPRGLPGMHDLRAWKRRGK